MNFLKQHITAILIGCLLIWMGLIGWFGLKPLYEFIVQKRSDVEQYYASRENRNQQIEKLPELKAQFETIERNEPALNILLHEDQAVDFVKTVEGLAEVTATEVTIQSRESGIVVQEKKSASRLSKADAGESEVAKSKAPGLKESLPYPRFLELAITVSGKYENIVMFLNRLENLPVALDVIGAEVLFRKPEKQSVTAPVDGLNPFLGSAPAPVSQAPERLQATFQTVVYIAKE